MGIEEGTRKMRSDAYLRVQTIKPPCLDGMDLAQIASWLRAYSLYEKECANQGTRAKPQAKVDCLSEEIREMVAINFLVDSSELTDSQVMEFVDKQVELGERRRGSVEVSSVFKGLRMREPARQDLIMTNVNKYLCEVIKRLDQAGLRSKVVEPGAGELRKKVVPLILSGVWPEGVSDSLVDRWHAEGKGKWNLNTVFEEIRTTVQVGADLMLRQKQKREHVGSKERTVSGGHEQRLSKARRVGTKRVVESTYEARKKLKLKCYQCHEMGHMKRDCKSNGGSGATTKKSERTVVCFECGEKGHKSYECKKKGEKKVRFEQVKALNGKLRALQDNNDGDSADA